MKSVIDHPARVFATGFIVLVFVSLQLFWIRYVCQTSVAVMMPRETRNIAASPAGLVPPEIENDPNVTQHSMVSASMHGERTVETGLGITGYFLEKLPRGRRSNVYFVKSDEDWMYFDKRLGQLVHQYTDKQRMPDRGISHRRVQFYIGPEGISEAPDKALGRFVDPIVDGSWVERRWEEPGIRELIVYDSGFRCFFKIDFNRVKVTKSSEIGKGFLHRRPIQIGLLRKDWSSQHLSWIPPQVKAPEEALREAGSRTEVRFIMPTGYPPDADSFLLVLDKSGRIDLLDTETLEFATGTPESPQALGKLPAPETYFASAESARPRDLLSYEVWPMYLTTHYFENTEDVKMTFGARSYTLKQPQSRAESKCLGIFATGISRDGTSMAMAIFNGEGKQIKRVHTRLAQSKDRNTRHAYLGSSKAAYWEVPWAPVSTMGKYLAENLHPPVLSVASYFTASLFEARSGHKALFLMPNSFIAMVGRGRRGNIAEKLFTALWWATPSIILAIWLATRVSKDAVVVGLCKDTRWWWIVGTIAFGLTGYITYRLTRPKITLVTCCNCGRPRRPDLDICHRCGSKWDVPELTPPAWRVVNGAG